MFRKNVQTSVVNRGILIFVAKFGNIYNKHLPV
jgi:hypothetical protein